MLGVISGSGLYSLGSEMKEINVETDYGNVKAFESSLCSKKVIFVPRHGQDHSTPPHKINYKANVSALKKLGASRIISVYSAGILSDYWPGDIVLAEDFIGLWTPATFFDDFSSGMRHVDFSNPFSADMKGIIFDVASEKKISIKDGGVIVTTPGPRFETRAEVRFLKTTGANLVSMTSGYEMTLLGESGIEFASMVVATNYGAGISDKPLDHEEVLLAMKKATAEVEELIAGFVKASG